MTLTDAGPLIAIIDADESDHELCVHALGTLTMPLITTWPAFTEAMYLFGSVGGITGQQALWRLVSTGRLTVTDLTAEMVDRAAALMDKYADLPMDLADSTLVALAEATGTRRIFTLDRDFTVYRLHGRTSFEIVPTPHA